MCLADDSKLPFHSMGVSFDPFYRPSRWMGTTDVQNHSPISCSLSTRSSPSGSTRASTRIRLLERVDHRVDPLVPYPAIRTHDECLFGIGRHQSRGEAHDLLVRPDGQRAFLAGRDPDQLPVLGRSDRDDRRLLRHLGPHPCPRQLHPRQIRRHHIGQNKEHDQQKHHVGHRCGEDPGRGLLAACSGEVHVSPVSGSRSLLDL